MARCGNCGTTILFGGKKAGNYKFCNENCLANGQYLVVADQISNEIVEEHTRAVHEGECPRCNRMNGPVDVHTAHKIWSLVLLTSWKNKPHVSCKSCGVKSQIGAIFYSLFLGWWGVPWGILVTPVQIIRNILGIIFGPPSTAPSEKLRKLVRINLGRHVYQEHQEREVS